MATFIQLVGRKSEVVSEVYARQQEAENFRDLEYNAAVKIQKWFRGTRVRYYLRHLVKYAAIIQRHWRGYLGRQAYREQVHLSLKQMRLVFYNSMAIRIQKRWRGYFVRRHVHNYHARKRYLEALSAKNEVVRKELKEYREQLDDEEKKMQRYKHEKRMAFQARKHHYLVSTIQKPGVYNSPYYPYPHEMEFRMRVAKPLDQYESFISSYKDPTNGLVDPEGDTPLAPPRVLPPLQPPVQGPFKNIGEVQKQRYKPLNPSLRVATDFRSLEKARVSLKEAEWIGRLTDEDFKPFSKQAEKYEKLLHSASAYGQLPYGTEYFREENQNLNVCNDRMKTRVSPIPIFDKFKKTYSKGAVMLQ